MLLKFVGQDGDYRLKNGLIYNCKVYTKKHHIWVRVNHGFKFPKKHISIPYHSIELMYSEWADYNGFKGEKQMTDIEKLNALVDYIRDAERCHLDNAKKGLVESGYKSMAVQDIQVFMEHKLGIEHVQLKSKID